MKEKKNYTVTTGNGRLTVSMLERGADGRYHSASCEYPFFEQTEDGAVKKSRKYTVEMLLKLVRQD